MSKTPNNNPKASKPSPVPFQINTRRTVYTRGAAAAASSPGSSSASSSRGQSAAIPVVPRGIRGRGGRLQYNLPALPNNSDDEMAQQPVDIQALVNAMTAMTTQLGQHTTQQNNNTVALQGALQAQLMPVTQWSMLLVLEVSVVTLAVAVVVSQVGAVVVVHHAPLE